MFKVSIITVCFNSSSTIEKTIKSVANQTYQNIEHIIKEGESNDGTNFLIEPYLSDSRIVYKKSADDGIYDAINQAIRLSSGDIICFLHSNDEFVSNEVVSNIVKVFMESNNTQVCYGNVIFQRGDQDVRYWKSSSYKNRSEKYGWMFPHTTLFITAKMHRMVGEYAEVYKISGDYDYILRLIKIARSKMVYVDQDIVAMKLGGASTSGIKSFVTKFKEDVSVLKKNNISIWVVWLKIIRKIPQLIMRK